ncbi:MAG: oligosaccharide flippase family protein [Methanothrix sp.]
MLPKDSFLRSVTILTGGTALGQIIVIIASPILTRIYTPEDFGLMGVYLSILNILSTIASLRYEFAIPLPEREEDASNLFALCLVITIFTSLLVFFGTLFFADQIVSWANTPLLRSYLWLLPVGVALVGTYQVINYWAVRKKAFYWIAQTKIKQGLGSAVVQIAMGLMNLGATGLIVGQILGQALGIEHFYKLINKNDAISMRKVNLKGIREVAVRYQNFPKYSSLSGLLNSFGSQLMPLFLAAFYGPAVAGWFVISNRVVQLPLMYIGSSISQVYFSRTVEALHTNPYELEKLFFDTTRRLLPGAAGVLILCGLSPWIFPIFFGASWADAGKYALLLVFYSVPAFIITPLSNLNTFGFNQWMLVWDALRVAAVVGSLSLSKFLGWNPSSAVLLFSIVMGISYILLYILNVWAIRRCILMKVGK